MIQEATTQILAVEEEEKNNHQESLLQLKSFQRGRPQNDLEWYLLSWCLKQMWQAVQSLTHTAGTLMEMEAKIAMSQEMIIHLRKLAHIMQLLPSQTLMVELQLTA